MEKFDVVVVGLGAMGSAALYQLSKQGLKVAGIDRFSPPHSHGSSHGETRITRQAIGEGVFYTPIVLRANQIWAELEKITGEELYNHCGLILVSQENRKFYRTTVEAANSFGIKYQIMDREQTEKRYPAIKVNPEEVVYFEPGGGFLRPEKCIEVQLKIASDNGAKIFPNTAVRFVKESPSSIEIKFNDGTSLMTDKLILSVGPWVKDFVNIELKKLFKMYLQTFSWFDFEKDHYEDLKPGRFPAFMCDTETITVDDMYSFPAIAGQNGGIKFATHEMDLEVKPINEDQQGISNEEAIRFYEEHIKSHVRFIKPKVIKSSNCIYTVTPDEDFIIDWAPNSSKILIASPCSGHGFKHSAAVGEILTQLICGKNLDINISNFSLSRFSS